MKQRPWLLFVLFGLLFYHVANLALVWPAPAPDTAADSTLGMGPAPAPRPTLVASGPRRDPSIPIVLPTLTRRPARRPVSTATPPPTRALVAASASSTPAHPSSTVGTLLPGATPLDAGVAATEAPTPPSPGGDQATPQPTASPTGATVIHTVQSGETLIAIARQYGVEVEAIVEANDLADPDFLTIGLALIIPISSASSAPLPTGTPVP